MIKPKRKKKIGKMFIITMACLGCLPCLAIFAYGIMYISGMFEFRDFNVHNYEAIFIANDVEVYRHTYKKGEVLEPIANPEPYYTTDEDGKNYKHDFIGWDLTGDTFINFLPTRVYGDIYATAVYMRNRV